MPDVKVSGLPSDSALDGNHYVPLNDPSGPTTKRTLLSVLAAFLFNQVNIPDGSGSPRTRMTEEMFDYVASGLVWSGDAYASTRNASMTSGVIYINGRRLVISSVTARSFTASKDVYVGVKDNGDGTGTVIYYDNTTNAASPTLATAGYDVLIAIIVVGAANIASVASVNQGQPDKLVPIASSIPYQTTDSLGNLICPRDPNRKTLGYRRITGGFSTASGAAVQVTGLSVPAIVPANRKVKATFFGNYLTSIGAATNCSVYVIDGAVGVGAAVLTGTFQNNGAGQGTPVTPFEIFAPTAGLHTFNGALSAAAATASLPNIASVLIELE